MGLKIAKKHSRIPQQKKTVRGQHIAKTDSY